jgi:hypothetical protein
MKTTNLILLAALAIACACARHAEAQLRPAEPFAPDREPSIARIAAESPFGGASRATFADLDEDGDLDLFLAQNAGRSGRRVNPPSEQFVIDMTLYRLEGSLAALTSATQGRAPGRGSLAGDVLPGAFPSGGFTAGPPGLIGQPISVIAPDSDASATTVTSAMRRAGFRGGRGSSSLLGNRGRPENYSTTLSAMRRAGFPGGRGSSIVLGDRGRTENDNNSLLDLRSNGVDDRGSSERGWAALTRNATVIARPSIVMSFGQTGEISITSDQSPEYFEPVANQPDNYVLKRLEEPTGVKVKLRAERVDDLTIRLEDLNVSVRLVEARKPLAGTALNIGAPVVLARDIDTSLTMQVRRIYYLPFEIGGGQGTLLIQLRADWEGRNAPATTLLSPDFAAPSERRTVR